MIYEFLADGCEEIEALCPMDMLLRAGLPVKTMAVHADTQNMDCMITGAHGIRIEAQCAAAAYTEAPADMDMVILPGGMPGAAYLDSHPAVEVFLRAATRKGAVVGAICAAPMILGKRGLLRGRNAVCFPGFEEYLEGAVVAELAVCVDGNMVTACGMGAAIAFGGALIRSMKGEAEARKILSAIQADRI